MAIKIEERMTRITPQYVLHAARICCARASRAALLFLSLRLLRCRCISIDNESIKRRNETKKWHQQTNHQYRRKIMWRGGINGVMAIMAASK